jgi:selenide,water dikinase
LPAGTLGAALAGLPRVSDPRLLIGYDNADDAAVFRLTDDLALVQTLDFFTPIVDDPYDFGRIAAANSLSDVFAMGGVPAVAMNIVCFPDQELPAEVLGEILRGGHDVVHAAGAVIGGGHSVSDKELKYGLSVTGTIHPDRIWHNGGARVGDQLVLTKPLGTGVLSTALKREGLAEARLEALVDSMVHLNRDAAEAGRAIGEGLSEDPIHAATDITGFGLLGHAIEVARGSGVRLRFDSSALPLLDGAREAVHAGFVTRGDRLNREYLKGQEQIGGNVDATLLSLMLDPQTSGGLLFFVSRELTEALVTELTKRDSQAAHIVGEVIPGPVGIEVHGGAA